MSDQNGVPSVDRFPEQVCTTSEAAKALGVSNTTVQIMVERGELRAWKTRGGHRRISLESVEQIRRGRGQGEAGRPGDLLSVLIAEDDPTLRFLYENTLQGWHLPLRLTVAQDGMEALLLIERNRPDVLITDLSMQPMDGFQLLRMLRARTEFNAMNIVVVTGLDDDEVENRGGLPRGVAVYRKPIPFDKLHGFLEAHAMRKQLGG